ncbi:hypothetical protein WEI85_42910 [Actinomycetes bacterium KLBMP 9797]
MSGVSTSRSRLGSYSLALGVIAVPSLFLCGIGAVLALAAIVVGVIGLRGPERGRAIAGIVLGALTVATVIFFILTPDS